MSSLKLVACPSGQGCCPWTGSDEPANKLGAPSVIKKPPVRRLRHVPWSNVFVHSLMSSHLTPDPTGLQFKPGDPYATIPIGSGLKFGLVVYSPQYFSRGGSPHTQQTSCLILDPRPHSIKTLFASKGCVTRAQVL